MVVDMKGRLAVPLVLLILQRVDSQNNVTGTSLPCGDDNLSCPVPFLCLNTSQLCDGTANCADGLDEGVQFANLDCK